MKRSLASDERTIARARPSPLARWRRYLAPVGIGLAGTLTLLAPGPVIEPLMGLGLTHFGALVVLEAFLVAALVAVTKLIDRHPVVTLALGGLAVSLGANLTATPWMGLPAVGVGLGWIGVLEVERWHGGLALTDRRVILPRVLSAPLGLAFDEIDQIHTTDRADRWGSIILETQHGTVPVKDLARPGTLADRIQARVDHVAPDPEPASVAEARARIEQLVDGARSTR